MLPAQPAATFLGVISTIHNDGGEDDSVGEVKFKEGVRMGALYDFAYKTAAEPISSFCMRWNMMTSPDLRTSEDEDSDSDMPLQILLNARDRKYTEEDMITIRTNHTVQCCIGMKPDVGEEFRSEGFEDLIVEMTEMRRLRW